jgi:methylmalonyl-CoA/ethylmalonyl-CoA epimerase
MEAAGFEITQVSLPQPAILFDGREVSFYSLSDVGLIELLRAAPP